MKLLLCVLLATTAFCCEDGWTQFNDYCYQRHSVNEEINTLQSYCTAIGANIISITSRAEMDFVTNMTKTGMSTPFYLQPAVGAYRYMSTYTWIWLDGTPFNHHNLFVEKKDYDSGQCAVLMVDKAIRYYVEKGSTEPETVFLNGQTGVIATSICSLTAKVFICKKKDTTGKRTEKKCGSTWNSLGSSCYKYFSEPSIPIGQANEYCKQHGASLASITTENEKEHIIGMTRRLHEFPVDYQTAIGCHRQSPNHPWNWYDGTPFNQSALFYPEQDNTDNCCMLITDIPLREGAKPEYSSDGNYLNRVTGKIFKAKCSWPAYQFICERKACDLSVSIFSDGKCVCNKGYVDITETTLLEASKYRKGEKCIPDKCHLKKDASVLFLLDSSNSITSKHWPKLLKFATNTALKLPTKYSVGFLKFSTNVTFEKFVKPGWNEKRIKKAIPSDYDAGGTNTPAALKRAKNIFESVKGKHKIAVLITDGLPFDDKEYESEEAALNATVSAAKELRQDGVRLIVMGVGPKICDNAEQVKQWVRIPRQDYVLLEHGVNALKSGDMEKLLKMVCN